ncbi:MAG: DUF1700 domain-containing protein [Clostridia bacterium]|nr:DUF1700 domain-containing protein [Clostridia bacterium]
MNKDQFLSELRAGLAGLPQDDVDERIAFYSEMIDDRIEEGVTEEEAVSMIGSVDEIVSQTVAEIPLAKLVKEKITPKRTLKAWEIVLICLGFPLWFPLLIAFGAVVLSLYIVAWSLIISLWAIELSFIASAFGGIAASVAYMIRGDAAFGVALIGASIFLAGLSIFTFFGCVALSKGIIRLTKKAALGIKSLFIRKESTK